jgi:hypothetical protein
MAAAMPGAGTEAEQEYLARALGALIAVRRFDSPIHQARAVHNATLALSVYAHNLPEEDARRINIVRRKSLTIVLSDDASGISESDRNWLIAVMRKVLGKAGLVDLAENRLH